MFTFGSFFSHSIKLSLLLGMSASEIDKATSSLQKLRCVEFDKDEFIVKSDQRLVPVFSVLNRSIRKIIEKHWR